MFDRYSLERSKFASELDQPVNQYGEAAGDTGHGSVPLRRGWRELDTRIRPKQDGEIALACANADEAT